MGKYDSTCWNCRKLYATDNYQSDDLHGSAQMVRCSHHGFVNPFDIKCSSFENAYRNDSYIERCQVALYKKGHYIVSTTCKILGLPEDCDYMNTFELVFDNYIKETQDGENLINEYNLYGCMVANRMKIDYEKTSDPKYTSKVEQEINKQKVLELINNFIIPQFDKINKLVNDGNVKSAILRYILLTRKLMNYYQIDYEPLEIINNDFNNKSIVANTLDGYKKWGATR